MTPSPRAILLLVKQDSASPRTPQAHAHEQERSWSCGPAALVIACSVLGHDLDEAKARELSSTSAMDGTDEHGLLDAITSLGLSPETMWTSDRNGAWRRLLGFLSRGSPVLLCVDRWDHWVTVMPTKLPGPVTLMDPAKTEHEEVGQMDLLSRWKHPDEARPYYAIAVSPGI